MKSKLWLLTCWRSMVRLWFNFLYQLFLRKSHCRCNKGFLVLVGNQLATQVSSKAYFLSLTYLCHICTKEILVDISMFPSSTFWRHYWTGDLCSAVLPQSLCTSYDAKQLVSPLCRQYSRFFWLTVRVSLCSDDIIFFIVSVFVSLWWKIVHS